MLGRAGLAPRQARHSGEPIAQRIVLVETSALCSDIYTPDLFSKVGRPVWPLDLDPRAVAAEFGYGQGL